MAINRTVNGFLFSDDFNRADGAPGANWSVTSGAAAIASNVLRSSTNNTNAHEVNAARSLIGVAQMRVKTPAAVAAGPTFRHADDDFAWYIQLDGAGAAFLFHRSPGYNYTGLSVAGFVVPNVFQRVKGSWKAGRFDVWAVDAGKTLGINSAVLDAKAGSGGLHFNNTGFVEIEDYSRYKSNVVIMTGLAVGQKLRVGAVTAVEVGGTATVDLADQYCPLVKVEVLNPDNSLFEELSPVGGVWGGDEYVVVAVAPDKPVVTASGITDIGFTLDGSAYVHSGGAPHTQTRWVVRDAFGVVVIDQITAVNLTQRVLGVPEGILANATYTAEVAYFGGGLWSPFSDTIQIDTLPSAFPALRRTTLGWLAGLLDFSRAGNSGADVREQIANIDLVEMVVQSIMTVTTVNPPAAAIAAKFRNANSFYGIQLDGFGNCTLYRCTGAGLFDFAVIDNFPFAYAQNDAVQGKLHVKDGEQRAWWIKPGGATFPMQGFDVALNGLTGDAGIRFVLGNPNNTEVLYDNYAAYRNNLVRVEELPAGFKTRIKDQLGNILFTDVEAGGVTQRDILQYHCPLVAEVLDESDIVVYSRSDVWGGDIYEYLSGEPTPVQRRTLERAWIFELDGHTFYVLNFTLEPALIYDLTTGQWHRWYRDISLTPATDPYWNMFRGHVWQGRVLAADMETNQIWELDPHSFLDEDVLEIRRVVTGFQPFRGSGSQRQGALRVIARKEDVTQPATLVMRFSNDNGRTWSAPHSILLAPNSISQRLEFRSLGRIRAPGRLWEIEDVGGFVRIEGADADLEGEE